MYDIKATTEQNESQQNPSDILLEKLSMLAPYIIFIIYYQFCWQPLELTTHWPTLHICQYISQSIRGGQNSCYHKDLQIDMD